MMGQAEESSTLVLEKLMDIHESIGELTALQRAANETLKTHTDADAASFTAISTRLAAIEKSEHQRKGAVHAWGVVATVSATMAGILADFMRK